MRGPGRDSGVAGGWTAYADEQRLSNAASVGGAREETEQAEQDNEPQPRAPKRVFEHADPLGNVQPGQKKRMRKVAAGRFGSTGESKDKRVLQRFDVQLEEEQGKGIRVGFQGRHVFAGIRQLVEMGVVSGEKMPGWMTGDGNVSVGVVREGRIEAWEGWEE